MAISLPIAASEYGVDFPNAYYRITGAAFRRLEAELSLQLIVTGYAAKPLTEGTRSLDIRVFDAPLAEVDAMPGADSRARCYEWLMANTCMSAGTVV